MRATGKKSRTYSALATFNLHTLGWKAFQDLCAAVASEVLGRPVQVFLPSKDGGRDGAFVGTWQGAPDVASTKSTIQCKFTSKGDATLTLSALKTELKKIPRLAQRGLVHDYIIMSNASISGAAEAEVVSAFEKAGAAQARVFGRDWLTAQIRERPRLRMMVPRLYGIGDLSQIIDERAYAQARYILSAMGEDLRCFVITDAHRKSVHALTQHGFVLLLGDPASGKSTIGASLAIGALDNGAVGTIRITSPEEFATHWNPDEPSQFFWVDDAFGPTQYQRGLTAGWNRQLPLLKGALKAGARILFTSRNYIWEAAKHELKTSHFPLFGQSQVIIDVQKLSETERAQILYNHIKMGDQPRQIRKQLKPFLPSASSNSAFLPETARRLGSTFFTKKLVLDQDHLTDFIEHPVEFLKEVLMNLDDAAKASIALIFLHGTAGVPSPLQVSQAMETIARLFGLGLPAVARSLEALNGSLTLLVQHPEGARWTYKHPTISDAFASLVAESSELIEIYIAGAKIERLLNEVVCGEVKIIGAQVRVPRELYDKFLIRLLEYPHEEVESFLTYRCDANLLASYLFARPTALEHAGRVNSDLSINGAINFLAKLHRFGLLPEATRAELVEKIIDVTITMVDASVFHDDDVQSLLSDEEFGLITTRFEKEIVECLEQVIYDWEHDWSSSDPSAHMQDLAENLGNYASYKESKEGISTALFRTIRRIEERAAELSAEDEPTHRQPTLTSPLTSNSAIGDIFDDVDE
jgi:hypothetical protein